MSFIDKFFVSFFNKKQGSDQFGNEYYIGSKKDYLGKEKRYVVYKGASEPSKVPPVWHAWLHHLSDELPSKVDSYDWQQASMPNLTGTKYSYYPKENNEFYKNKLYNSWQPKRLNKNEI